MLYDLFNVFVGNYCGWRAFFVIYGNYSNLCN